MIQIKFKNLERSALATEVVRERIGVLQEKFADLQNCRMSVTLEMDNSPLQAGPDLFSVKLHVANGRYKGITVRKSDPSLYKAVAALVDRMLEKLNRAGDRERVKARSKARRMAKTLLLRAPA